MRHYRFLLIMGLVLVCGIISAAFAQGPVNGQCGACALSIPVESTPLVVLSKTTGSAPSRNVTLTIAETLGGFKTMLTITGPTGQPDPAATVRIYGTGFFGSRRIPVTLITPGTYGAMANLASIDELAVRVCWPGYSKLLYFGIPGERLGFRCAGCAMAECTTRAPGVCKNAEGESCSPAGACMQPGACKMAGEAMSGRDNCPKHKANQ